jgi:Cu/Ag efflux protein CusF
MTAFAIGMWAATSMALAEPATGDGQVVKADRPTGKITIKHGPLKQLGMDEGMTMVYRAADPAMFDSVNVGDKIKFTADRLDGQFTIIKIQKPDPAPRRPQS